jgi:hypothetical protein
LKKKTPLKSGADVYTLWLQNLRTVPGTPGGQDTS